MKEKYVQLWRTQFPGWVRAPLCVWSQGIYCCSCCLPLKRGAFDHSPASALQKRMKSLCSSYRPALQCKQKEIPWLVQDQKPNLPWNQGVISSSYCLQLKLSCWIHCTENCRKVKPLWKMLFNVAFSRQNTKTYHKVKRQYLFHAKVSKSFQKLTSNQPFKEFVELLKYLTFTTSNVN